MQKLLWTALAVIVAGCAGTGDVLPTPPAEPIHDHLIVPGVRAGPISLGMTAADLYRAMGEPLKSEGIWQGAATEFTYPGLTARVSTNLQRINYIYVTSPEYATRTGVRVGISDLAVRASNGSPTTYSAVTQEISGMCYANGLAVNMRYGVVSGVVVWTPGCP